METTVELKPAAGSPDAEAVMDFLGGGAAVPGKVVPLDLPPGAAAEIAASRGSGPAPAAQGPAPDPAPEPDPAPLFGEATVTPQRLHAMAWNVVFTDVGPVDVTPDERDLYWKAFNADTPVVFTVTLMGDVRVECRALTQFEHRVIARALAMDGDDRTVSDPASFASQLQVYSVAMQALSFNGDPLPALRFADADRPLDDLAGSLRRLARKLTTTIQHARWTVLMTALRIFIAKLSICDAKVAEQDAGFFRPAGTG